MFSNTKSKYGYAIFFSLVFLSTTKFCINNSIVKNISFFKTMKQFAQKKIVQFNKIKFFFI